MRGQYFVSYNVFIQQQQGIFSLNNFNTEYSLGISASLKIRSKNEP